MCASIIAEQYLIFELGGAALDIERGTTGQGLRGSYNAHLLQL